MSNMFYGRDDVLSNLRVFWGRLFGDCIGKTRLATGRSIEESARLAGMEASEWAAVEAGYVPRGDQLRPMADALGVGFDKIATLTLFCKDAWEG